MLSLNRPLWRADCIRIYSGKDAGMIIRYHCAALMGLLQSWTEKDTQDLDYIVHSVYRILKGEMAPMSEKLSESCLLCSINSYPASALQV